MSRLRLSAPSGETTVVTPTPAIRSICKSVLRVVGPPIPLAPMTWMCGSIRPGSRMRPETSTISPSPTPVGAANPGPTAAISPPSIKTSAAPRSSGSNTCPPLSRTQRMAISPPKEVGNAFNRQIAQISTDFPREGQPPVRICAICEICGYLQSPLSRRGSRRSPPPSRHGRSGRRQTPGKPPRRRCPPGRLVGQVACS